MRGRVLVDLVCPDSADPLMLAPCSDAHEVVALDME
jgi:hypothetical protein